MKRVRDLFNGFEGYVPVVAGLAVGAMAHFGKAIQAGKNMRIGSAIGYIMQLFFVGLLASVVAKIGRIETPEYVAFVSAITALAMNEIVQAVKARAKDVIIAILSPWLTALKGGKD